MESAKVVLVYRNKKNVQISRKKVKPVLIAENGNIAAISQEIKKR